MCLLETSYIIVFVALICGSVHPHPGPDTDLSICHVNMRSLQPHDRPVKLDELYSTLCIDQKFQIICVSETWLDTTIENDIVSLPDYQLFRKGRDRHGGGIAIYALNSLPVKYLTEFSIDGVEIVCIEIKLVNKKINIACIYNRQQADEFL